LKFVIKYLWVRFFSLKAMFYKSRKNTYLFLPINGAGLGHLTRSLAIARRLQRLEPSAEIIFLTTSIGVTLVHRAGFACHHVTPAALVKAGSVEWNTLFFQTIENVLRLHKPATLVFDGTIPYLGLQRIMHNYRSIKYVWVRRGLYKPGIDRRKLDAYVAQFNIVISPGELVSCGVAAQSEAGKLNMVEPISLLDKDDLLERDVARRMLRLDSLRPCAYVQLGAGNINGISDMQERVISLLKKEGVQVVLAQSPIALRADPNMNADSVVVDYPNSKYFAAFDFAVLAGGYNSVCEAVSLGLPAIFLPNTATGADDQVERVRQASQFGSYEYLLDFNEDAFAQAVGKFLSPMDVASHDQRNGAVTAAELILNA
jgi:UDP-N-acetylglucosamine--N-acetylmuramyl-(pentapeptide) pyrophosphoryl-undecaprenol N-acetylglucosamine transferase